MSSSPIRSSSSNNGSFSEHVLAAGGAALAAAGRKGCARDCEPLPLAQSAEQSEQSSYEKRANAFTFHPINISSIQISNLSAADAASNEECHSESAPSNDRWPAHWVSSLSQLLHFSTVDVQRTRAQMGRPPTASAPHIGSERAQIEGF